MAMKWKWHNSTARGVANLSVCHFHTKQHWLIIHYYTSCHWALSHYFEVITTAIVGEKMYINGLIFKPSMMKKLPLKSNQTNNQVKLVTLNMFYTNSRPSSDFCSPRSLRMWPDLDWDNHDGDGDDAELWLLLDDPEKMSPIPEQM